jgi:hypothetical protein
MPIILSVPRSAMKACRVCGGIWMRIVGTVNREWVWDCRDCAGRKMFYTWVCLDCSSHRDYGSDTEKADNPTAWLGCEECGRVTCHQQYDEEGNAVTNANGLPNSDSARERKP